MSTVVQNPRNDAPDEGEVTLSVYVLLQRRNFVMVNDIAAVAVGRSRGSVSFCLLWLALVHET